MRLNFLWKVLNGALQKFCGSAESGWKIEGEFNAEYRWAGTTGLSRSCAMYWVRSQCIASFPKRMIEL